MMVTCKFGPVISICLSIAKEMKTETEMVNLTFNSTCLYKTRFKNVFLQRMLSLHNRIRKDISLAYSMSVGTTQK